MCNKIIQKQRTMKAFEKTFEVWCNINSQLYHQSLRFIKRALKKEINQCITLDSDYNEENVCVVYDGGNHPEYYANPFSQVNRVYLKDGDIYLDTDDAEGYDITNINAESVCNIAIAVKSYQSRCDYEN